MCEWGFHREVVVTIPSDLSHTGKAYSRPMLIDLCIADLVEALSMARIGIRSSCCGHGKERGFIVLEDGRTLWIEKSS